MPYCRASSSAVSPMIIPQSEQVKPSRYIASTSVKFPILWPQRASSASIRYGMRLIDSMPPATTTSDSPSRIDCAPVATACMPDAQALLIVCAGALSGSPARRATCRAGLGPDPACRACPMSTSSTRPGSTPARLERRPGGDRPELGRVDVPERPAVAPDRRARRADDHDLRHRHSLSIIAPSVQLPASSFQLPAPPAARRTQRASARPAVACRSCSSRDKRRRALPAPGTLQSVPQFVPIPSRNPSHWIQKHGFW